MRNAERILIGCKGFLVMKERCKSLFMTFHFAKSPSLFLERKKGTRGGLVEKIKKAGELFDF